MVKLIAFKNTVSETVVNKLNFGRKYYIESNRDLIENFVTVFSLEQSDLMVALGEYSGKDKDKLRVEATCTNKFRNNFIEDRMLKIINLKTNIKNSKNIKISNGIGNSYCNLFSYLIMSKYPDSNFYFIHVPKGFNVELALNELNFLKSFQ